MIESPTPLNPPPLSYASFRGSSIHQFAKQLKRGSQYSAVKWIERVYSNQNEQPIRQGKKR